MKNFINVIEAGRVVSLGLIVAAGITVDFGVSGLVPFCVGILTTLFFCWIGKRPAEVRRDILRWSARVAFIAIVITIIISVFCLEETLMMDYNGVRAI